MSNAEFIIVLMFIAVNLILGVIAWWLATVNQSIKELQASNIVIASTTHSLMKENLSELQRARLRVR